MLKYCATRALPLLLTWFTRKGMVTRNSITFAEVTLSEAKAFVRVDTDAHDALLTMLIEAAHEECFAITHNIFGTATFTLERIDQVYSIDMPFYPVTSIDAVYLDDSLAVEGTDYKFEAGYLNILTPYTELLMVDYTCGTELPADIKHAILQRVKYGFDYGDDLQQSMPRFFERVAARHRNHKTFAG